MTNMIFSISANIILLATSAFFAAKWYASEKQRKVDNMKARLDIMRVEASAVREAITAIGTKLFLTPKTPTDWKKIQVEFAERKRQFDAEKKVAS